eukprot:COSAG05_NODE_12896_length_450_cov_0.695157_1_plen_70_part_00
MYALKMAPKMPAAPMVAAGCGLAAVVSISNLGISSGEATKTGGAELQAQIIDAAAHIEAQREAIASRIN